MTKFDGCLKSFDKIVFFFDNIMSLQKKHLVLKNK
jgi:hypothetical protein